MSHRRAQKKAKKVARQETAKLAKAGWREALRKIARQRDIITLVAIGEAVGIVVLLVWR